MRRVEFKGYALFDENELQHGENFVGQIEHELYNVDGAVHWEIIETSNEEVEVTYDEVQGWTEVWKA